VSACEPPAFRVHPTKTGLCLGIPLIGSFAVPNDGLCIVLRRPLAISVHHAESELSKRHALIGQRTKEPHRCCVIVVLVRGNTFIQLVCDVTTTQNVGGNVSVGCCVAHHGRHENAAGCDQSPYGGPVMEELEASGGHGELESMIGHNRSSFLARPSEHAQSFQIAKVIPKRWLFLADHDR
jgi:hypothetical protein